MNQNNFFRSVRNIHIDLRSVPAKVEATGLHWQVSQATSLQNVVVDMSTEPGTQHRGMYSFSACGRRYDSADVSLRVTGMFMENGSGGFMGGMYLNINCFGIWVLIMRRVALLALKI